MLDLDIQGVSKINVMSKQGDITDVCVCDIDNSIDHNSHKTN